MVEFDVYLGALRRSWRLLVALAVVFAIVAAVLPVSPPKAKPTKFHWQSAAIVGAEPAQGIGASGVTNQTIMFFGNLFYAKYAAAKAVGLEGQIEVLSPLMSASTTSATSISSSSTSTPVIKKNTSTTGNLVQLIAPGTSAAAAAKLANAYSKAVEDEINTAYAARLAAATAAKTQSTLPPTSGFGIVQPAFASAAKHVAGPQASITSSRKVRLLIGIVVGLLVGAIVVLVRELRDKTIKTRSKAESAYGFPVIAEFPARGAPSAADSAAPGLEVWTDPASITAETYRLLRISINFEELAEQAPADPFASAAWQIAPKDAYQAPDPASRRIVMVASAGDEQTRAIVAANLAAIYSEAGQQVIVISTADIESRRSAVEAPLPVTGPADIEPYLLPSSLEHVSRLSLRPFVNSSAQLVNRAPAVLQAVRELADLVIVEAGPLLSVHHGEALAHAVDVTLVVAECRTTPEQDARRAGELIRRIGVPVLGIVLTNVGAARGPKNEAAPDPAPAGPSSGEAPSSGDTGPNGDGPTAAGDETGDDQAPPPADPGSPQA